MCQDHRLIFQRNGSFKEGDCGDIKPWYSATVPYGWLLCDGSSCSSYADLCSFLGTTSLPDLRECVLVGAGQSANEYNSSTNPNGIHEHDVYDVGEFKDDQFQGHFHKLSNVFATNGRRDQWPGGSGKSVLTSTDEPITDGTNGDPRTGTTTHGKQMGVNWIIKW